MSTQSEMDFEWSVKLIGDKGFCVGITSRLSTGTFSQICVTDQNAISYFSTANSTSIKIGKNTVHSNLPEQKTGDVIRFQFRPLTKNFTIELASVRIFIASRPY